MSKLNQSIATKTKILFQMLFKKIFLFIILIIKCLFKEVIYFWVSLRATRSLIIMIVDQKKCT